jgi:hypothetical protein
MFPARSSSIYLNDSGCLEDNSDPTGSVSGDKWPLEAIESAVCAVARVHATDYDPTFIIKLRANVCEY